MQAGCAPSSGIELEQRHIKAARMSGREPAAGSTSTSSRKIADDGKEFRALSAST
jgi:hypothetical protein